MEKDCRYERVPQEPAEEILERILEFRSRYDQYQRPEDVNFLLGLFPHVSLEEGYILDYLLEQSGDAVQQIVPFARPADDQDLLFAVPAPGADEDPVETLYQYLKYERTPQGIFEYAFFVTELWATRASWHAAEWLSSTPVFTRKRFDELVEQAEKVDSLSLPEWYGPEAGVGEKGGWVRFLVYTEMGWERIYYLEIEVDEKGRVEQRAGEIVADLGRGFLF